MKKPRSKRKKKRAAALPPRAPYPIKHWSHSSLVAFLRNPLAWYKRYVVLVRDAQKSPAALVGIAGHKALEHFYQGVPKDAAIAIGLENLRNVADFEINFGKAKSKKARRARRESMEDDYLRAIGFYLAKPPRHNVVDVEVSGVAEVPGLPLPVKAVSDLVVESRKEPGALDIVDHKFVENWSGKKNQKALFVIQALFNYYTVSALYGKPVRRFLVYECKKSRNRDGGAQLRRYALDYRALTDEFAVFHRLLLDASAEIARKRAWLPNPSDMFEGEESFDLYRMGLVEE